MQNVAREEAHSRRTIARVHVTASVVLLASTLLAWENHPKIKFHGGNQPGYYVAEVSHTIGLATLPAGLFALALAVFSLAVAGRLRDVHLPTGWLTLLIASGALATCVAELIQLLIGRRNWIDDLHTTKSASSSLSQGVGVGVWVATLASVVLVASATWYLWRGYRTWRDETALP